MNTVLKISVMTSSEMPLLTKASPTSFSCPDPQEDSVPKIPGERTARPALGMMDLKGQDLASLFWEFWDRNGSAFPAQDHAAAGTTVVLQGLFPVSVSHRTRLSANKCFTVKER